MGDGAGRGCLTQNLLLCWNEGQQLLMRSACAEMSAKSPRRDDQQLTFIFTKRLVATGEQSFPPEGLILRPLLE